MSHSHNWRPSLFFTKDNTRNWEICPYCLLLRRRDRLNVKWLYDSRIKDRIVSINGMTFNELKIGGFTA